VFIDPVSHGLWQLRRPNRHDDRVQDGALDRLVNLHQGDSSLEGSIKPLYMYIPEYSTRVVAHVREETPPQ